MKTEISRDSHQPDKRYSGVYQQQGRMLVDADWNELVEILKHRIDEALRDVVGSDAGRIGGTPRHRGLQVIKATTPDPLTIEPGQVYVDGLRGDLPGTTPLAYDDQQDFPSPPPLTGDCTVYADVWERTVTQLMDARLRDPGLHGADTCTRKQTLVQVKWCPGTVDPERSARNPSKGTAPLSLTLQRKTSQQDPCDPCAEELDIDSRVGNYLFRVEVHDVSGDADNPTAATLKWSSENGAEQTVALTDKASMPEGFISDRWVYEFFDENSERHLGVHLDDSGWTPTRGVLTEISEPSSPYEVPAGLGDGDLPVLVRRWDGYCELDLSGSGSLDSGVDRGVTLSTASAADSLGHVSLSGGNLSIVLDNVLLQLDMSGKSLVAGDYWIVDVREIVHDPGDPDASMLLDEALPFGIEHRYLTLGSISSGALADNPERDRKYAFPTLTEMTRIFSAGGDGQEVMPGEALPQPLRVGVGNGEWPVVGASVRFNIEDGGGTLTPAGSAVAADEVISVTDSDGIAACTWSPESGVGDDFRVKATLIDPDDSGNDFAPPVFFYANLITADQVAYEPACPDSGENAVHSLLVADGTTGLSLGADAYYTVAEVLDALLCKLRAKHLPYDASNVTRWEDINEEEGGSTPETVQEAIDALLENLQSEDISYTPACTADTPPTVRSLLAIPGDAASRVHTVLDRLLCDFNATALPVDRADLCTYLEAQSGSDRVETVQDALNALCRREQGGGCCEITISPGDDLEARLRDEIISGSDVNICICDGEYILQKPVILEGLGHVTVQGCGFGTVIRAPQSESAFILRDCERVVVRRLSAHSSKLGSKSGSEFDHLNGAVTVHNVNHVLVEHVSLTCAHGGRKQGSCLTIANQDSAESVRVNDCRLEPGHQQVGLLVVNTQSAWIQDNEIQAQRKTPGTTLSSYFRDKHYRLSVRKIILNDAIVVPPNTAADSKRNVQVRYGNRLLRFRTEARLAPSWRELFSGNRLPDGLNDRDLLREVKHRADSILLALADGNTLPFGGSHPAFRDWFDDLATQLPAIAGQAIVCGGTVANDLVISGNALKGVRQGIHVGLSHRNTDVYRAGRVLIRNNNVRCHLSAQEMGDRHAIFVGNFTSLHIEGNHLQLKKFPGNLDEHSEGIRVYGFYGEMMQVRGNCLRDFRPAIYGRAEGSAIPEIQLWQVENNVLQGGGDPDLQPQTKFITANNPN